MTWETMASCHDPSLAHHIHDRQRDPPGAGRLRTPGRLRAMGTGVLCRSLDDQRRFDINAPAGRAEHDAGRSTGADRAAARQQSGAPQFPRQARHGFNLASQVIDALQEHILKGDFEMAPAYFDLVTRAIDMTYAKTYGNSSRGSMRSSRAYRRPPEGFFDQHDHLRCGIAAAVPGGWLLRGGAAVGQELRTGALETPTATCVRASTFRPGTS